ncbi:MAG: chemotaxis-specific protein-glutamate methyltransferase CheB [Erythrobacter sp.]
MQPRRAPTPLAANSADKAKSSISVMIVDDSLTVRTVFSRMIGSDPALRIVATANSGEAALQELSSSKADVILLDLEMPGMGGLDALPKLLAAQDDVQILVVSSLAKVGAEHTIAALAEGAADTMLKPRSGGFDDAYRLSLLEKIKALGGAKQDTDRTPSISNEGIHAKAQPTAKRVIKRPEILAFGASTGGIHALNIVLRALPPEFALPIVITQHLPANFVPIFARQIEAASGRPTHVAVEGTKVDRGEVLIATGKGHMEFTRTADDVRTAVSTQAVSSNCLPSVDPMLASLAKVFDGHALGVILSGMGRDGLEGASALVAAGGGLLAQDAQSSAVWGMPGAVSNAGIVDECLPPLKIAQQICDSAGAAAWR